MPPPDDTDESIRIFRQHQSEVLADASAAEPELNTLYKESADAIRVDLRDADNMNGKQIRGAIDRGFQRTVFRRRRVIAKVIEEAAPKGARAARKTLRAVFGEETTRAQLRTSKAAMEEGAERIAGRTTVDKVSLSKRIRGWDEKLGGEMASEIQRGLRSKKGIEAIARDIQKLDSVHPDLPAYLQRVEALARKGSPELKKVAKQYLKRAQKMGAVGGSPYSLKGPTQRFLRDIQKAGAEGVDAVVSKYVEQKAAWRANVIAKQESLMALDRAYVENSRKKPGVYAYQWRLSGSHPRIDICDAHAAGNECGLGSGMYTAERLPDRHVGCICAIVAQVDSKHFDRTEGGPTAREEYADRTSPDRLQWLRSNPDKAAAILGPTRHELLKRGVNVLDEKGAPRLVRDLLPGHAHAAE